MPYSIMLDAGHGGKDPGAVYNGRQEKDDTLALTLAVGEILQGEYERSKLYDPSFTTEFRQGTEAQQEPAGAGTEEGGTDE